MKKKPLKIFDETFSLIKEMRSSRDAPVDKYGPGSIAEKNSGDEIFRFHVLVALLLSSQTKDEVTQQAMTKLKTHGLTVDNILSTKTTTLETLIKPAGFFKRKADYLKRTCKILSQKYSDDIPNNKKELKALPGIGEKMANIIMEVAWHKTIGIGVDTHVHRISNRLGWVNTRTPEQTCKDLEDVVDRKFWSDLNYEIVGFGQTICKARSPLCDRCMLSKEGLCDYFEKMRDESDKAKTKKKKKRKRKNDESQNDQRKRKKRKYER